MLAHHSLSLMSDEQSSEDVLSLSQIECPDAPPSIMRRLYYKDDVVVGGRGSSCGGLGEYDDEYCYYELLPRTAVAVITNEYECGNDDNHKIISSR